MNNPFYKIFGALLAIILITGFAFNPGSEKDTNHNYFKMYFEQNGKKIDIVKNEVTLSPAEFDIVYEFPEPMAVLVNASFNNRTYTQSIKNLPIDKLTGFTETGMAEGLLNSDKEVLISNEAPSYWFYETVDTNRFNKVFQKGNELICYRTIKQVYYVDNQKTTPIKELNQPLYIVSISYKSGEDLMSRIEVDRETVKINWKK